MSESLFVEQAARTAAREPQLPGEETADRLLAQARKAIYHWPKEFGGFYATLALLNSDGSHYEGEMSAVSSRKIEIRGNHGAAPRWLRFQLEELLSHRESPEVSKMANRTGATLGDFDPIYGQQVFLAGDSMQSFYRIANRRLTQIGRKYRSQDLLITIDSHHEFEEKFVAWSYTAFYRSLGDGALKKVETYLDSYREVESVHLPASRRVVTAEATGVRATELRFSEHRLL